MVKADKVQYRGYEYKRSTRAGKKLMVEVGGKMIHFGDSQYQHYRDGTGIWRLSDHLDPERRDRYLARAMGIKGSDGKPTYLDPTTANYHAVHVLW